MRAVIRGLLTVVCLVASVVAAKAQDEPETRTFAGLKFGAGLSFTIDTGTKDRVDNATIDANGIVRVDKTSNGIARIMLEAHYFFSPSKLAPNNTREYANWGIGPFVAVQPGSDEIINSIGIGAIVGFRYSSTSNQSFNIGFGLSVDPTTRVLGEEFVDGNPAPTGPNGEHLPIRFVTREQTGILILASFAWR